MKVTLDISKLLEDGQITRAEHDKLLALSRSGSRSHAWNILIVLATIACVVGFVAWKIDLFLPIFRSLLETFGERGLHLLLIFALLGGGYVAKSGFLVAAGVMAILSYIGGSSFYSHASYYVAITEPALTVALFSVLGGIGLWLSRVGLPSADERLVVIFARTCLFVVNMGFWVGSLWGSPYGHGEKIPDYVFAVAWALALVGVGAWGANEGRRFVVNLAATFGAIHFYTQWFERLGASPFSLMAGGLVALGILYGLRSYNRAFSARR